MKKKLILSLVGLSIVSILLPVVTYGWFSNKVNIVASEDNQLTSNGAYYASGDGTKENPFIISEARHLYNLAWLQDLGYYNDEKNQKYFEVVEDIDMSSFGAIPPIGIDNYPFISSFEGNGHIISNLEIDTIKNNFTYTPSNDILNAHINDTITSSNSNGEIRSKNIGIFGEIKNISDSKVSNFYINNAKINQNKSIEGYTGIIAGYVNANISKIGVANSYINLSGNDYLVEKAISKYTLIGDYNDNNDGTGIQWTNKPGEQGNGFGGSLNFKNLNRRLNYMQTRTYNDLEGSTATSQSDEKKILQTKNNNFNIYNSGIGSASNDLYKEANSKEFDYLYTGNSYSTHARTMYFFDGSYFPINIDLNEMGIGKDVEDDPLNSTTRKINDRYSTYSYEKIDSNNTGYFIGGKSSSSAYGMVAKMNPFYYSSSTDTGIYKSLGMDNGKYPEYVFNKETDNVTIFSNDINGNKIQINDENNDYQRYATVKEQFLNSIDGQSYFPGVHFYRTINTSSLNLADIDIPILSSWDDTNKTYTEFTNKQFVKNAFNFDLSEKGYITVIAATCFNNSNTQKLFDLYKINRDDDSKITGLSKINEIKDDDGNVIFNFSKQSSLTDYGCLYYFEIPVQPGEYILSADSTSSTGAYLSYLDIGTNGTSGGSEVSKGGIKDIDFVNLSDAELKPFDENNTTYTRSKVAFEIITNSSVVNVQLYFERDDNEIEELKYSFSGEGVTLKPLDEGKVTQITKLT